MTYALEKFWFLLIAITVFNVALAEGTEPTFIISTIIAITTCYKGLVVIDHFMELKGANVFIRGLMRFYFILFPSLIVITYLFGDSIAKITGLS